MEVYYCVMCIEWHSQFETATSTRLGTLPAASQSSRHGRGHVKVNQTLPGHFMLSIRIFSGSCVRGHPVAWLPWGASSWGFLGAWAPPGTTRQVPEVQWQCVATVLSGQRTVHQNDSKFPDASLTLAKTPHPLCGPSPFFPQSALAPASLFYQPRPLRLPRRPRPIQPHPSANQSVTLERPSTARLSPPVRPNAVNSTPKPSPPAAPLGSITQSISHSKPRQPAVAPRSYFVNQQPNPSLTKSPTVAYRNGAHENLKFPSVE